MLQGGLELPILATAFPGATGVVERDPDELGSELRLADLGVDLVVPGLLVLEVRVPFRSTGGWPLDT